MANPAPHVNPQEVVLFEGSASCCGAFSDWCRRTRYRITTAYIERTTGICCVTIENIQLLRIKDIGYHGCCCCSTCSTIEVLSSDDTSPKLFIRGVPGAEHLYQKLREAVNAIQGNARLQIQES